MSLFQEDSSLKRSFFPICVVHYAWYFWLIWCVHEYTLCTSVAYWFEFYCRCHFCKEETLTNTLIYWQKDNQIPQTFLPNDCHPTPNVIIHNIILIRCLICWSTPPSPPTKTDCPHPPTSGIAVTPEKRRSSNQQIWQKLDHPWEGGCRCVLWRTRTRKDADPKLRNSPIIHPWSPG